MCRQVILVITFTATIFAGNTHVNHISKKKSLKREIRHYLTVICFSIFTVSYL